MPDSRGELARRAVADLAPKALDADVSAYLAETAADLAEDADGAASFREELTGIAVPLLEDLEVPAEEVEALCAKVAEAAFRSGAGAGAGPAAAAGAAAAAADEGPSGDAGGELLCCVRNLLLMYGGSPTPLLKNARLELWRGHRYGVVGANGTGKTTLMSRVAKKDIAGFPEDLGVVHLRHEKILEGIGPKVSAREYARRRNSGSTAAAERDLARALADVGFDEELLGQAVGTLSGGWQMRLALACAVAQRASLLILDEPTNHLDAAATAWLAAFVKGACGAGASAGTALIVSHDADFLNEVCTDIVHFTPDGSLVYHPGDFAGFKAKELKGDEARAQQLLEVGARAEDAPEATDGRGPLGLGATDKLIFPAPEKIAGAVPGKAPPPLLKLRCSEFQHDGAPAPILTGIDVEMTIGSRVGVVGKNGSGKSTLLSLLAARLPVRPGFGELWMHESLRLVYIAQHHESQLADFGDCTPAEYIQRRFQRGYDAETPRRQPAHTPNRKEAARLKELGKKFGKRGKQVEALVSRHFNGEECLYEVKWVDLGPGENTFEKRSRLKGLGVLPMVDDFDGLLAAAWGDGPLRPLTQREVARHLEDFGLPEDAACSRRISELSSGQKTKMMLAASFWTRPHIICLDEPTNYLDADTVEALQKALRGFKGAFAIVSHNEKFLEDVCEELWEVRDGRVAARPVPRS